ncbi:MAG: 3-oxoacyl-ACP reductase [Candidatus Handelsmanbacteria bacterium RIFCSPLOWO2_12_FULL_64_10]|uniref:3-oxoacyl-ACP reductase n=1 Tax=Handelsmanbacteria sp. (strain RIFCSPLOWO2_12_FULL_64_10) TaxID=1817868 RepID=A0A1F6CT06_HANXR|nr:MAG: 3-oxoacyl-ACP reductase [Candidatus Handelsmanbacteria bacterium RIFCSPLOWO2_12_FULL_64_10]
MLRLDDKMAIVTGAAQGIGRAIALRLAQSGAHVAVADLNFPAAEGVAGEVCALGRQALPVQVDVSSGADAEEMVRKVLGTFGRVDILVNNAGIGGRTAPIQEVTDQDWDSVMAVNLKGVFLCCRAVIPHMIQRRSGKIVSIASVAGKEGNPNMIPYSTSKAGIICLTKCLAKEVATVGINVNCVAPAVIETDILKQVSQETVEYMKSRVPMGRFGRPEEVANVVNFLASDEAAFVTGQCYDISGGRATY